MFRVYEKQSAGNIIKMIVVLIICSALTGCSVLAGPRVWRQTGPDVPELSVFDEVMKELMVSRKVSAGALAITFKSRLVFAHAYTWSNGVNCVVLFNKRGDSFDAIDPLLWEAVKSIPNWPKHDLFNEVL